MTLYISSLPFETTLNDLRCLLSQFGPVSRVRVIVDRDGRSKGYGFAEMADADAQRAIQELDGQEYGWRTLRVSEARPPRHQSAGAGLKVGVRA